MTGETRKYQHLGSKAFWLFFFQNCKWLALIVVGILVALFAQAAFLITPDLSQYLALAALGLVALFFIVLVGTTLVTWLQYVAYEFSLDEHSIRIKKGIFNVEVEAIPYRQIQNVDIERDIFYRLIGVSRLIILTAGEDNNPGEESEGVIPAIDKNIAAKIQEALLERANVERTIDVT